MIFNKVLIHFLLFILQYNGMEIIMINVTRLNGSMLVVNADIIQTIEETPDTVITLTTGSKYIVKESSDEIIDKVVDYKHMVFS